MYPPALRYVIRVVNISGGDCDLGYGRLVFLGRRALSYGMGKKNS